MFAVGENTGNLDDQLQAAANYLDRELDYKIKRFTALIEPAVILTVGLVVGFVAIALVSAMYGIFHQVKINFVTRPQSDAGFTLIELLVVLVIMPLVIGAIAAAIIISEQDSGVASSRLSDSASAQTISEYYVRDVQGAEYVTTDPAATSPAAVCAARTVSERFDAGAGAVPAGHLVASIQPVVGRLLADPFRVEPPAGALQLRCGWNNPHQPGADHQRPHIAGPGHGLHRPDVVPDGGGGRVDADQHGHRQHLERDDLADGAGQRVRVQSSGLSHGRGRRVRAGHRASASGAALVSLGNVTVSNTAHITVDGNVDIDGTLTGTAHRTRVHHHAANANVTDPLSDYSELGRCPPNTVSWCNITTTVSSTPGPRPARSML